MRRFNWVLLILVLLVLLSLTAFGASGKNTSHEAFITQYEGPKTCENCHAGAVDDVLQSVHYKMKGPVSTVAGLSGEWGMINRETGLPGSIMKINVGCVQCHIGNGTKITDTPTAQEREGIDCLICHAKKYDYSKRSLAPAPGTPEGFRVPQDRSLEAARSVGDRPSNEACFRCHKAPAGGYWWKRGINFTPERDVHVAKGMICVDCHKAMKHKFANINDPGGWAKESTPEILKCESCHGAMKHKNPATNNHLARISCNVCHIPTIGGVVTRDYVNVAQNPKTGLYVPKADVFDDTYSTKPTYRFFNGTTTQEIEPIGSFNDPKSRITAFKPLTTVVPEDKKTKRILYMNLGVLAQTGSVDKALAKGIEQTKQPYSGEWEPKTITGYFSLSHDIAKNKALSCSDCHSGKDYMGFGALGYSKDNVARLTNDKDSRFK